MSSPFSIRCYIGKAHLEVKSVVKASLGPYITRSRLLLLLLLSLLLLLLLL